MLNSGFGLRQLREYYQIKQYELASMLGFSPPILCDIEKGRRPLTEKIKKKSERIFEKLQNERETEFNARRKYIKNRRSE